MRERLGRRGEGTGRRRQIRGPRLDSFRGEGKKDAGQLPVRFDLLGKDRDVGCELSTAAARWSSVGAREGEKRREREQVE